MKKTTFVRKGASLQRQLPTGTKPSVHNGQLLVSSGLHDLDGIIGGGFPLGSLVIIEEDRYSEYCQHLLKYFLSEGITNKHTVVCGLFNNSNSAKNDGLSSHFAFNYSRYRAEQKEEEESTNTSATTQNNSLPESSTTPTNTPSASNSIMDRLNRKMANKSDGPTTSSTLLGGPTDNSTDNSELKIAWRYQDFVEQQVKLKQQKRPSASSGEKSGVIGTVLCSEYDLSKPMQEDIVKANSDGIHMLSDLSSSDSFGEENEAREFYEQMIHKISTIIQNSKTHYSSSNTGSEISSRAVVRIGLQSLGSLFYQCDALSSTNNTRHSSVRYMLKFLLQLKALLRSSLSVCVCTLPKYAIQLLSPSILHQIEQLSDLTLSMDSFTGAGLDVSDWEFKEYSGLFYIKKLFKMNSLTFNFTPDTLNYAFKLKKRKMYIEKLHLPPEETREASNPDRPKFRASTEVEKHKMQVERVKKDASLKPVEQQADDHVFGCASQASITGDNPLDF